MGGRAALDGNHRPVGCLLYGDQLDFYRRFETAGLESHFPDRAHGGQLLRYHDVRGQANAGFILLWMGLVTSGGLLPPTYPLKNPVRAATSLLDHVGSATNFPVSSVSSILIGGGKAYDGPFYQLRSPIEVADQVGVPAFITGGLHDIFQRGEPLLYEQLNQTAGGQLNPWEFRQRLAGRESLRWIKLPCVGLITA